MLSKLELWNGNSDSIHEHPSHCNGDLQNQLTQVTDELKQLKMQLASPQTNDSIKNTELPNVANQDDSANKTNSVSYSFVSQTAEHTTLSESLGLNNSNENDDKDKQIQILSNKLIESDKEASELKKEIERLRDIINQKSG